ncbi:hypothetical protein QIS74_08081 [Colletotrichum tabaci]|uniref:Uncharacterized protein n=1 Tax=Colletotrichum tabaci TaxID=1209068 RepID=A0AAV9T9B7_9PEZI
MAQERMSELDSIVRRQYHRFPAETWELTRKALEDPEPYRLFQHIEVLIFTRRIDDVLRKNPEFRALLADMYGNRYDWLRDADLGTGRWENSRENAAESLAARAKESEKERADTDKKKRDLMIEKIVEGGDDVVRWAKVLGFENVAFPIDEIQAAATRMKTERANLGAEGGVAGYGVGEAREDIGGVDATACPDGPEGTYGPSSHMSMGKQLAAMPKEHKQPPPVPKAPAEGGAAPRNPFTTEWRHRDAPNGWTYPATFDPYYSSNQFIRRSTRYKLPYVGRIEDDDDEEESDDAVLETEETEDDEALEAEAERDSQTHPATAPTGLAAMITTTRLKPVGVSSRTKSRSEALKRKTRRPKEQIRVRRNITTVSTLRQHSPPVLPFFKTKRRTDSQHGPTTGESAAGPSITITSPTDQTRPFDQFEQETETSALAPALGDNRIYTPPRDETLLSPQSTDETTDEDDVDMVDADSEDDVEDVEGEDEDDAVEIMLEEGHGQDWLIEWLKRDRSTSEEDLRMIPYHGWRVHSPKVQLILIKNFLADEDMDRTMDWERKFAEIGEFLQYCLRREGVTSRDWYVDLCECIGMLHMHWMFEQYHYGDKKLVVDFPAYSGVSTRLPPLLDGRDLIVTKRPKDPVRPRYLLHRVPESVQDVDYQIPGPLLRTMFMTWFRQDGNLVWSADPNGPMPGSGQRGEVFQYQPDFNMALTEDLWFVHCMDAGPETTATGLRGEANFYLLNSEYVPGEVRESEVGGRTHKAQIYYPEGEAQQRFARYRGAKRAALQQCLSHFDAVENVAIQSPFRKLVLPLTRRQKQHAREVAGINIVYKPHAVKTLPKGAQADDPLGLVYWFQKMRENHGERADAVRGETEEAHRGAVGDLDTVLLPHSFLGPITPFNFLKESERRLVARHTLLVNLRDRVRRAYGRNPRQMLEGVVENMDRGRRGEASWNMRDELTAHRERHGRYLEMNDMELYWVDFVCGPSTNAKAQREALPNLGRPFEVFTARVQTLLDEPSRECLFGLKENKVGLQQVTMALNASLRQGDYVFTEDMVNKYSWVLADHGRLGYERAETGEVRISRPECPWHPENRMNWPRDDDHWDPATDPWTAANVPSPDHTWDWETAFANVEKVNATRRATKRMLWSVAYRVGIELDALAAKLAGVDDTLSRTAKWEARAAQLEDLAASWRQRFDRPAVGDGDGNGNENENGDGKVARRPVSYISVVKAGYPGRWKKKMTEEQAVEIVRRGIIDELSAGASTLWPSRPRFSRVGGRDVMTLHRERVWEWARPAVVGPKKRFFSVNRWPVHLQSETTQTEIRTSAIRAKAERKAEEAQITAEMARVEARARPTAEEVRKAQLARSLSVPFHEANDPRTQFFPGHTEYWEGDTPLQKKVLEAHVQRVIDEELGPNDGKAPRGTGWFGLGRAQASSSSGGGGGSGDAFAFPDVVPDVVPRSVPARAGLSLGRQTAVSDGMPSIVPRVIERREPLLSPRYPPDQQPQRREPQRRVRFEDPE